mmetsp:Transcript_1788/g.3088  ORF Transcript_1788/g.3088 Transcript_1788/m.3088 type:complete len:170 (-) Transcript_1788:152-661(-)
MPQSLRIQVLVASLVAWASAGALAAQAAAQAALEGGPAGQGHQAAHQPGQGGAGDQEVGEATSNPASLHQLWDQRLAAVACRVAAAILIRAFPAPLVAPWPLGAFLGRLEAACRAASLVDHLVACLAASPVAHQPLAVQGRALEGAELQDSPEEEGSPGLQDPTLLLEH